MTMKLSRTLTILWAADADAEVVVAQGTFAQITEDDDVAAESTGLSRMLVAASGNSNIPFGPVTTATRVLIISDRTVTLKLNGGDETFTLVPKSEGSTDKADWAVFYLESALTAVNVANAETEEAAILFALAGV